MNDLSDLKQSRRSIAVMRRVCDGIWLGLSLAIGSIGGIAWLFTRNPECIYAGLFYGAFPLIGFVYFHFVLLNPRRDPAETQQRLVELQHKQQKNARTVAVVNGGIIACFSPFVLIIGVAAGAQHGVLGVLAGVLMGAVCLTVGLLGIAWGRRGAD